MLRDDGAVAVADIQLRHGSAHSLLHHLLVGQDRGQFLPDGLRKRQMQVLAQHGPVQMVRQAEHVPPGLVTLRMVTVEKACRDLAFNTSPSFQPRLYASCIPVFIPWPPILEQMWAASPSRKTRPA